MRALRVDAEIAREGGIAGENRRLPAVEPLAQHAAEFGVELGKAGLRADALAVGRIGHDEPPTAPPGGGAAADERAPLDVQPIGDAGAARRSRAPCARRRRRCRSPKMQRRGVRAARRARASARSRSQSAAS